MATKYYTVKDIAEMFSLREAKVRQYCHADGQKFAFQQKRKGSISIDLKKFEKWFTAQLCEWRRTL